MRPVLFYRGGLFLSSQIWISPMSQGLKVAVVGCNHGELDKLYETIEFVEKRDNIKIDLCLCCGDFQAVRNEGDLSCMACPPKYREMNTFYKYYSGEKTAPVLTIFIGGNHEASNHNLELFHGGWAAPNIYFMGYAGVLNFGGLRIAGMSGIFKQNHFNLGHYECPPYDQGSMRSAYHLREYELFKLLQVTNPIDIFLSHDWPRGVAKQGDTQQLFRKKKFLKDEVLSNTLGSPPSEKLLHVLQPSFWFSAHLHVKFAAVVKHSEQKSTKFLALDKCLPHRDYLQVVDFPEAKGPRVLRYDEEWLAIVRSTHPLLNLSPSRSYMPTHTSSLRYDFRATADELKWIRGRLTQQTSSSSSSSASSSSASAFNSSNDADAIYNVPNNFQISAPVFVPPLRNKSAPQPEFKANPQTSTFCKLLDIPDQIALYFDRSCASQQAQVASSGPVASFVPSSAGTSTSAPLAASLPAPSSASLYDLMQSHKTAGNPEEISLDDDEDEDDPDAHEAKEELVGAVHSNSSTTVGTATSAIANPEEIDLDDE